MLRTATLVATMMACATPVLAQGSGSRDTAPELRAFGVDATIDGRVVRTSRDRLTIEDNVGRRHTVMVPWNARFRADRRSRLGLFPTLELAHYVEGTEVRVTLGGDGAASQVDARRPQTRSARGVIVDIDLELGILAIETADGEKFTFSAFSNTELKRDGRSTLAEIDEDRLRLSDYASGLAVSVEFRVADRGLTELKAERQQ